MMNEPSKTKQLVTNMIASLLSTLVSLAISLVVYPKIIDQLGLEANGFLGLANDFVTYAAIAAMALNSMAGRFITVKLHQNDTKGANQYFNAVMYSNMAIVGFLIIPIIILVMNLDKILNIPASLIGDVKLLFIFTFINFMVTILSTTFSTATFATNRLDLTAMRKIESELIRAGILVAVFLFIPIKVSYIGFATLAATVYLFIAYIHYTKKLLPQIEINRKHFRFDKVKEILSAGIWNTVMRTGQTLTNSLDTLISNLMIGTLEMGYVGSSKPIVGSINALYETIAAVFTPALTISFAKNNKKELVGDLTSAMKLTGFFANIPLAFVAGFGVPFYTLWLARTNSIYSPHIMYILTLLTMFGTIVGGVISPLFNVYTVVNKLKWNSMITLGMGILSTAIVFLLLSIFDPKVYGMYIVVGTSTVLGIIKNLTFTPLYAAHCLKIKKTSFYPVIFRYTIVSIAMIILFVGLNSFLTTNSWGMLLFDILLCGVIGSIINFCFLFGKKEKQILLNTIFNFIKKNRNG